MQSDPPPPPEHDDDPETRAVIERAERAWQRQAEREEQSFARLDRMTPFRWILLAIAVASLITLIARNWLGE